MIKDEKLIFELSKSGLQGIDLNSNEFDNENIKEYIPDKFLRNKEAKLPEVGQLDILRHFSALGRMNYDLSKGIYPLGSCTMKYNPVVNEQIGRLPKFANIHPKQPIGTVQGVLEMMYNLQLYLSSITGMKQTTLQPAAGAHGELTGMMMIKKYHQNNRDYERNEIIIPDSAHGTNPASAIMAGFKVVEIESGENGLVDIEKLKNVVSNKTAGLMLTNPNTLGLFEKDISEIADIIHDAGGLLYYDGANLNAIMGVSRPGDMGFDVVHLNLHKTFSTPHGGGGPGSGPVGVSQKLIPFLPKSVVCKDKNGKYFLQENNDVSIGQVKAYYGHILVFIKAYAYILALGEEGLKESSMQAVLNANYLKNEIEDNYQIVSTGFCKHEFVVSGLKDKLSHVSTLDVAKRLLDAGYHPPTIYFPLIVPEAMMFEPTESEDKKSLDKLAKALNCIAIEAKDNAEIVKNAPHTTFVKRLDEVKAARKPIVRYLD
jgi:glycine dehydrogenase subunit 2